MSNSINTLLTSANEVVFPFELSFNAQTFRCVRLLRFLSNNRVVVEAFCNEQHVVIKLFVPNQKGKRNWKRELRGYQAAKAAKLNVPEQLLNIEVEGYGYAIVYSYIDGSHVLTEEKTEPSLLMAYVASLHDKGIYQDDFHFNNILLSGGEFYLIDLSSVRDDSSASLKKDISLANLALLVAQYSPNGQKQMQVALSHYYQQRGWEWDDKAIVDFEMKVLAAWNRRKNYCLSKCFRSSTRIKYERTWQHQYSFERAFIDKVGLNFINEIESLVEQGKILKAGNSSTVVGIEYAGYPLVIKRYNVKGVGHFLRRCLRPSRAAHSWKQANLLQLLNLPHMHCHGFLEKRWGPLHATAYLIIDWAQQAETLDKVVLSNNELLPNIYSQMKTMFSVFRDFQVTHGDCKATNFLYQDETVSLIDLDAMYQVKSSTKFALLHQKDKTRFLKNWVNTPHELTFKNMLEVEGK